jgi:hypothetical protein
LPAAIGRRLREDANLDCMNLAVLVLDPGRGDEVARLDVGKGLLDQRNYFDIRSKNDGQRLPLAGLDHQIRAIEFFDCSANPGWRAVGLALREHRSGRKRD